MQTRSNMEKAALKVLQKCMGAKDGEQLLIICDAGTKTIARALTDMGTKMQLETVCMEMLQRCVNGEEPPETVARAMLGADIIIGVTSKSLTHTIARKNACSQGARIATMPGITEEIFTRTMGTDYLKLHEQANALEKKIHACSHLRITSAAGTNVSMLVQGRKWHLNTGIYHMPGQGGNLPAGEIYIAPVEGTANGIVVVDGSFSGLGILKEPITLKVINGIAVEVAGGKEAQNLELILEKAGDEGRNIAELGIGINEKARISGVVLEDEKVKGTVHIALGSNITFGGNVKASLHLDGVIRNPSLEVDGKLILKTGIMLF